MTRAIHSSTIWTSHVKYTKKIQCIQKKFHCHNPFHYSELQKLHAENLPSRLKFDLSSDQEKGTTFTYLSLSTKQESRLRKQKKLS